MCDFASAPCYLLRIVGVFFEGFLEEAIEDELRLPFWKNIRRKETYLELFAG